MTVCLSPYTILRKEQLTDNVFAYKIFAPRIAAKAMPGQFVIVRPDNWGERVPLTIAGIEEESIVIVFMQVGVTSHKLSLLEQGQAILDVVGPLGEPSVVQNFGTVVCVAGGFAIAPMVPVAQALKKAGNRVIGILGARNKAAIFWQKEFESCCDEFYLTTDDGSVGQKGLVTHALAELCQKGGLNRVIAIGPAVMMKHCAMTTQPFGLPTIVSLNPIMVDGTGMCGCCRLSVGGEIKITCVDGPEFNGHLVDWDTLLARQQIYRKEEKTALGHFHSKQCLGACSERKDG